MPDGGDAAARPAEAAVAAAPAAFGGEVGVGSVIRQRFELIEEVGAGGMGRVFKALDRLRQEALDRTPHVAVKVLAPAFRDHPAAFVALQRETKRAQDLAHPNIVRVYDFDRDGTTVYMTMEFLRGRSLDALVKAPGFRGLPLAEVVAIAKPVGEALAYAHAAGVIHADLKPSNVFQTDDGRMKVIDFGIARSIRPGDGESTVFDAACLRAHTPLYASPEMIDGEPPDPRDDVFALACIIYQLLTGDHPFRRQSAASARRGGYRPVRPASLNATAWRTLARSLAFARTERLPSVAALLQGLELGLAQDDARDEDLGHGETRSTAGLAAADRPWRWVAAPTAAFIALAAALGVAGVPAEWARAVGGGVSIDAPLAAYDVGTAPTTSHEPVMVTEPDAQPEPAPTRTPTPDPAAAPAVDPVPAALATAVETTTPLFGDGRFGVAVGRSTELPEWVEGALLTDSTLLRGIDVKPVALDAVADGSGSATLWPLKQGGASLLVWTDAQPGSRAGALRLTASPRLQLNRYLPRQADVLLPRLPAEDAAPVLRLILLTHFAVHEGQHDRGAAAEADPLPWAIDAVRKLLDARGGSRRWNEEAKAGVRAALADALNVTGRQNGRVEAIVEAVDLYQASLRFPRARAPETWAQRQNNLGTALAAKGELRDEASALVASVEAFRLALQVRERERAPLDWASTQHNLGNALTTWGERESETGRLLAAVEAYRAALAVRTRELLPLDWAATTNDLGTALAALGEREKSAPRLEEAIAALRDALQERGRDRAPLDWAATQNNLALALGALGALDGGTRRLEEAVATYDRAMQVYARETYPARWAALQNNLGTALEMLADRRRDSRLIDRSCAAFAAAAQEFGTQGATADAQGAARNLDRCRNRAATLASR